jgi:hypothetical protein
MSSSPAEETAPSAEAEQALKVISKLSDRERLWVLKQMAAEQADDDELHPELRQELLARLRSIQDGTAVLLDGRKAVRELRSRLKP